MTLTIRLGAVLAVLWLLLSGMFKTQLLVLGLLSVVLVVRLAVRMRVLEHRGQPLHVRYGPLLGYWFWLLGEILKSNIEVTRRVLAPGPMPIRPALRRVTATPDTEIGCAIYANSITLTPGTTAINFTPDGDILVHALHEDSLAALDGGDMAARVRRVEPSFAARPAPPAVVTGAGGGGGAMTEAGDGRGAAARAAGRR